MGGHMRVRTYRGLLVLAFLLVGSGCQTNSPTQVGSESSSNTQPDAETKQKAKKSKWRMQLAFPGSLTITGEAGVRIAKEINQRASKELRIKTYEPSQLVKPLELFDAVAEGRVDAGYTTAVYASADHPSANFFTAVPFGAVGISQYEWVKDGEGRQLFEELFEEKLGVKALPCSVSSVEGGGWFKKPINSAQDLDGLNMRFFGLGGKVASKLGVRTSLIAGRDLYPSLKRDVVDGVELSSPAVDYNLSFYEIAKYYYYPAWHQKTALNIIIINQKAWNSLSDETRLVVENVCDDNILYWLKEAEVLDNTALTKIKEKGVTIQEFPEDVLQAAKLAWDDVIKEEKNSDELFSRVSDAYKRYLDTL